MNQRVQIRSGSLMRTRQLALFPAVFALAGLSGCGVSVVGPKPAPNGYLEARAPVSAQGSRSAVVFSNPGVVRWYADRGVPAESRFEFARRDALVPTRRAVPLRATAQWPVVSAPFERPVQFNRFDQD